MAERLNIADRIRGRIDDLGITQVEAAVQIGVDQSTISRWLRGRRVGDEALGPLADWLGVSADDLAASQAVEQRRVTLTPQQISEGFARIDAIEGRVQHLETLFGRIEAQLKRLGD